MNTAPNNPLQTLVAAVMRRLPEPMRADRRSQPCRWPGRHRVEASPPKQFVFTGAVAPAAASALVVSPSLSRASPARSTAMDADTKG